MATRTDTFDLGALRLTSGEGRRIGLEVAIEPLDLGNGSYAVGGLAGPGALVPLELDISRMTGSGYALHIAFDARLHGPCMRCLGDAAPSFTVDAREVSQPGEAEELESPYVLESMLDLDAWARDALVLSLPPAILCRPDCLGLCPVCGADLNTADPEHHHDAPVDPRWAALSDLSLEAEPVAPDAGAEPGEPGPPSPPQAA